jgi:hypothetical protein
MTARGRDFFGFIRFKQSVDFHIEFQRVIARDSIVRVSYHAVTYKIIVTFGWTTKIVLGIFKP